MNDVQKTLIEELSCALLKLVELFSLDFKSERSATLKDCSILPPNG